jgi:tetratricopeptide (TPR) repeat protein
MVMIARTNTELVSQARTSAGWLAHLIPAPSTSRVEPSKPTQARVSRRSAAILAFLVSACGTSAPAVERRIDDDYLYDHLGTHHRAVTTTSQEAQRFFDQGLILAFSFSHDEAIRSFSQATKRDPHCAMAWWGIALANGPHINFPLMTSEKSIAAWAALEQAQSLAAGATPVERALIQALSKRYAQSAPSNRQPLDSAYAAAMREVWSRFPDDADVGTLYAEALMDLHPWDLWTIDGQPKQDTQEIVGTLETVLGFAPDHPGANHLYVHAVEASPDPSRAKASAERLRTLVPDVSHMVHMPAHIDIRTGRYAQASRANELAIEVDRAHAERTGKTGFYQVYMAHNEQFLSFSTMMEGRSAESLEAARAMVEGIPREFLDQMGPLVDGYMPIVFHVLVRFGRWKEVLRERAFPDLFGAANAVRYYARGVALTALGKLDEAQRELDGLDGLCAAMDDRTIGNNPAKQVLQIPQKVLRGELEFARGHQDTGIDLLREAVAVEDSLVYDEPPDWMMPVRHTLGALLVTAGRFEEAEKVYRQDLSRFPENGWSLFGLAQALEGRGLKDEAAAVRARFEVAWQRADVQLRSSCFCQAGT